MRNGIVVSSSARRPEGRRALARLAAMGGDVTELTDARSGSFLGIVRDGAPDVFHQVGEVSAVSIGSTRPLADDVLHGATLPDHTVCAAVDRVGRGVAASGAGNLRLFAHVDSNGALVSTSVAAVVAGLGRRAVLDRSYEDFHLGFGFLPEGRTMYEGVSVLPRPARIDVETGEVVDLRPATADGGDVGASDSSDLAAVLLEVLEEQASGVDHVGVLLGGFDSALVAAGLHHIGKRVSTFTFDFEDASYNQRHVDEAVRAADADHHPVRIDADVIWDSLHRFPEVVNQPGAQPHYQIQTIVAARAARAAGVERLFSGDGCDALFLAYPTVNTRAAAGQVLGNVPDPVVRVMLSLLSPTSVERRLGHVARVGRSALRSAALGPPADRHLPTQYLDAISLGRLDRGERPPQAESTAEVRRRLAESVADLEPVRRAFDGNRLAGHSQVKVEGAALVSGLLSRSPYAHPRFARAVAQLPQDAVRPPGRLARAEGKPVLARAALASGLLPRSVVDQPKQAPTLAPIDAWYAGALREQLLVLLDDLPFVIDRGAIADILRPKRAEALYRRRLTISDHAYQAIGLLASYASFARLVDP